MPGTIKKMLDTLILERAKGDPLLTKTTQAKLMLKGINLDLFTDSSDDDPVMLQKIITIAGELGVKYVMRDAGMTVASAYSLKRSPKAAAAELRNQFVGMEPKMVLYFASSIYPPDELAKEMQEVFGASLVIGCSTAGELVSGKVFTESIVAMALNSAVIEDICLEILQDVKGQAVETVDKAFEAFSSHYQTPSEDLDYKKYLGLVLIDGLSSSEETIMDAIGNLTNVTFIGGSAGDDRKFSATYVYANGKAYTNAALLVLLKTQGGFDFLKTQSFKCLDKALIATKVNETERLVLEFNGKPAVQAYAELLGIKEDEAPQHFMSHPIGLMIDGEPFVRSPKQVHGNAMSFYCALKEGMTYTLLEATDIINDTQQALKQKLDEHGNIAGIINFNCLHRTLELQQKGLTTAYGRIFANIPTIGFNTYGEAFIGHMNQTATMLLFR